MKNYLITTYDGGQFTVGGKTILDAITNCGLDINDIKSVTGR